MKKNSGFTLFEVLVAVSIFAIIGVMATSSLIEVGKTGEQVSDEQRRLGAIQFALAYFSKDIFQIVDREVRDQYGDAQPVVALSENQLTFTRQGWPNLLQQTRSELQRVEYTVVDDVLTRSYWLQLDQGYEEQKVEQGLLPEVTEFAVALITRNGDKISEWPLATEDQNQPQPVALEITMTVERFGELQRVFEISDAFI